MMPTSPCRLCGATKELQESHILPGFVFRWKKETSATGYLRFGQQPNLRVQDGVKLHLLCRDCEQRFNNWETEFANRIFHPDKLPGSSRPRKSGSQWTPRWREMDFELPVPREMTTIFEPSCFWSL